MFFKAQIENVITANLEDINMRSILKDFLAHMRKDCTIRNLYDNSRKDG